MLAYLFGLGFFAPKAVDPETHLGRERRLYVRLTRDRCTRDYGSAPCTAALGVTGAQKCWKTFATCQDVVNFNRGSVKLVYGENVSGHPKTGTIFPALLSVSERPVEINLSGIDPKSTALGKRARVTVSFRDFVDHDAVTDPYHEERRSGAAQADGLPRDPSVGTHWTKMDARDPYFEGRLLEVVRCLPGDDPFTAPGASYLVAEWAGPGAGQTVTVTAQDPLNLLDGARALYPPPSQGQLAAEISVTALALVLEPAGVGNLDYAASGLIAVGREIMAYTRVGDAVTITARAAEGTVAATHKAGDAVQQVAIVTGRISDALAEVLTGLGGPIAPALVNTAVWAARHDEWMAGTVLRAVMWQPTSRAVLAGELLQLGVGLVYDETVPSLEFFVNAPLLPGEVYPVLSEDGSLIEDTVDVVRAHEQRISAVFAHHGMADPTAEANRAASYARHNYVTDPSSASATEWGSERIQPILLRWFGREGNVNTVKLIFERLVSRYRDAPHVLSAQVDARDYDTVAPGKRIIVETRKMPGPDGLPQRRVMQVNMRKPAGGRVAIRAETFTIVGRFGFWLATPAIAEFLRTGVRYIDLDARLMVLQWQTDDTSVPVTAAGDPVGRVEVLARVMPVALTQATLGSRPVAQAGYLSLDGTADLLEGGGAVLALLRAAERVTVAVRFRITSLAAAGVIMAFSTASAAVTRLQMDVQTSGNIRVQLLRADGDSVQTFTTTSAPVAAGADVSAILTVDWVTGAVKLYVNGGADLLAATMTGAGAATTDTASARMRLGATLAASPTLFFPGRIYRVAVVAGVVPDATARAAMFADLAAALPDYDNASVAERAEGAWWFDVGAADFGDGTGPYLWF